MRIRQVVWVAEELEPVVDDLCRRLDLEVCYRDPNVAHFGLRNALLPVGDTFLEVVSPVRGGTTAGRYLDRRGGDGGYMVIFQVDDLAPLRRSIDANGIRVVFEAHGDGIHGIHLHPADVGGAIVSLDVADPVESWAWAGTNWSQHVRTGVVRGIAGVELESPDPARLANSWARVLQRPVEQTAEGILGVELDEQQVRFVPDADGRGEGITAFDLRAGDPSRAGDMMEIAGVTVRLV